MAADDLGGQGYDGDPRHLADVGYGAGRPGVHLDDVHILPVHDELDVDHPLHMESPGQLFRVVHDRPHIAFGDIVGRVHGDGITGMDPGPLDVLHDPRDQDVLPVADRVYLQLLSHDIFIHQDRVLLGDPVDDADEVVDVLVVDRDLHPLTAQHVGGPHQHRIAQLPGRRLRLFSCIHRKARGPGDLALL